MRGSRKFGDKSEKIEDQDEVRQIRRQALKVIGKGVLVAFAITLIIMFIP